MKRNGAVLAAIGVAALYGAFDKKIWRGGNFQRDDAFDMTKIRKARKKNRARKK